MQIEMSNTYYTNLLNRNYENRRTCLKILYIATLCHMLRNQIGYVF